VAVPLKHASVPTLEWKHENPRFKYTLRGVKRTHPGGFSLVSMFVGSRLPRVVPVHLQFLSESSKPEVLSQPANGNSSGVDNAGFGTVAWTTPEYYH